MGLRGRRYRHGFRYKLDMGYTTRFDGRFKLDKPLDDETYNFLIKFNETRRMKRNVDPKYGIDGEFYVDGTGFHGQDVDATVVDYNKPPSTQPGLWCHWRPSDDKKYIEWDEGEKFYSFIEWIEYLVKYIFAPRNYILSGTVVWYGEEPSDYGKIRILSNRVFVHDGVQVFEGDSICEECFLPKEEHTQNNKCLYQPTFYKYTI